MNEINPLIWPSPGGIGITDQALWDQTISIAKQYGVLKTDPAGRRIPQRPRPAGPHGHYGRHQGGELPEGRRRGHRGRHLAVNRLRSHERGRPTGPASIDSRSLPAWRARRRTPPTVYSAALPVPNWRSPASPRPGMM